MKLNSADNICKDSLTGRDWTRLSGGLKHISVSGGVLYGVNSKDDIYSDEKAVSVDVATNSAPRHCHQLPEAVFQTWWSQISELKQVSVWTVTPFAVNGAITFIARTSGFDRWQVAKLPGGLVRVRVWQSFTASTGTTTSTTIIPCAGPVDSHSGKLKQVDLGRNTVCGVNAHDIARTV